jgi:hypothetical protein
MLVDQKMALEYLDQLSLTAAEFEQLRRRTDARTPFALLSLIIAAPEAMVRFLGVSDVRLKEIAHQLEEHVSEDERAELRAPRNYPYATGALLDGRAPTVSEGSPSGRRE